MKTWFLYNDKKLEKCIMISCRRYLCVVVDVPRYKYLLILVNTSDEQQNNTKWMFRMYLVWGPWIKR